MIAARDSSNQPRLHQAWSALQKEAGTRSTVVRLARQSDSMVRTGGECVTNDVPVIVITGNMGAGKTTILAEASDLLTRTGIVHAAIDLDTLGMGHFPDEGWCDLPYQNLSCAWHNYAAAGASRLMIAEALESDRELARIQQAVTGARIVVCRVSARLETLRRRVAQREVGILRDALVARVDELQVLIDRAQLEQFTLATDEGRSVTDTARELLSRAQWLPYQASSLGFLRTDTN